ncbi:MAG: HNH endonuclease, partial [Actinomycetes bacterium]
MAWLKVCDTTHSHPSVLALAIGGDISLLNETLGWLTRCASYSADHELDGWVPEAQARAFAGARYDVLLKTARAAGILERTARKGGPQQHRGLALDMHTDDRVFHILTKAELTIARGRRGSTRQQDARMAVRLRDGDQCRYCLGPVDFTQRKTARAGTYEHPDPADRGTFVIACRACNQTKGTRTAEQWHTDGGHPLHDPPAQPHYTPQTTEWLTAAGLLPADGSQPPAPLRTPDQPSRADGRTSTQASRAPHEPPSNQPGPAHPEEPSSTPPGGTRT